jgi:hypothetical protein
MALELRDSANQTKLIEETLKLLEQIQRDQKGRNPSS